MDSSLVNDSNAERGRVFQEQVCQALVKYYKIEFLLNKPILIGNPPHEHKFDAVSIDSKYVAECKRITWRKTDKPNVNPSAKLTSCNEAISYLKLLPDSANKLLVIKKDVHPRRKETLAQYYKRTNNHLLGEVKIMEFDPESSQLIEI
jgi:hypothetical protein